MESNKKLIVLALCIVVIFSLLAYITENHTLSAENNPDETEYPIAESPCYEGEEPEDQNLEETVTEYAPSSYDEEIIGDEVEETESSNNDENVTESLGYKEIYCTTLSASSSLTHTSSNSYNVNNLYDGDCSTAWVEGVNGYGIGESITFTFTPESKVKLIKIYNGYAKNQKLWKRNSRVKKLQVYYNGEVYSILKLEDVNGEQIIVFDDVLGGQNESWTLKLKILDIYKGDVYDDTAISEIAFN